MTKKFSFLEQLNNTKAELNGIKNTQPAFTIKYQEYEIVVEGKAQTVFIPVRETELFEKTLEKYEQIGKHDLREILRMHRGIREKL